jgi:hypothetical protein
MAKVTLKQGEAKRFTLTVTDGNGAAVDLTGCSLFLAAKRHKQDAEYAFSKEHSSFDVNQAGQGIVSVFVTGADTNQVPGLYVGELKVTFPGAPPATVEKSGDLIFSIEESVTA